MARKTTVAAKRFKIVAICQIYNELERGNLERFLAHLTPLVDAIVAYDDSSTDGSYKYLLRHTPHVIRGHKNDFIHEIAHKQALLKKALTLKPDFILHIDADEVFTANAAERLQALCQMCFTKELDGLSFQNINLWRSHSWHRTDSQYDEGWFVHLWRVTPELQYTEPKPGLHQPPYPASVKKIEQVRDVQMLHYGFASEQLIAYKYLTYRSHGQRGYMMLDRLINEDKRELKKVSRELVPPDLWIDDPEPKRLSMIEALAYVETYKESFLRPHISIVCMVYKSVDWLKFVYEQVLKYTDMDDKEFFFVANDANESVLTYLENNYIPHHVFTTTPEQKKEWYINNVYRAWNFGAEKARGDFVVFINSDMAFTPDWLEKLWNAYDTTNCVASRLVESGKLRSGRYGIEKSFGSSFDNYQEERFQTYAPSIALNKVEDGGLFMPLLIRRDSFLEIGGYPEGNVKPGSDIFNPTIAQKGEPLISGDVILMDKLKTIGVRHQTAFSSIVYHFQEGEMDSSPTALKELHPQLVAICNDLVTGCMGERVLWDFMLESLPSSAGVDKRLVGEEGDYTTKARRYIRENLPDVEIIIQNATFIGLVDSSRYTISFLQDDLRRMKRHSAKQERNLDLAKKRVANSIQTAYSYYDYDFDILPVGTDTTLFHPMDKKAVRKEMGFKPNATIGIFVGNFSEVKGWSEVKACIEAYPHITWILVTKHQETFEAANARVYNQIAQDVLAKLLNCANFFIIGSPVETQCLAAIEACACDTPIVMHLVGIFRDWSETERNQVGIFSDNLVSAVAEVQKKSFSPRAMIIQKDLTVEAAMKRWKVLLTQAFQEMRTRKLHKIEAPQPRGQSMLARFDYIVKYVILRRLFRGRDYSFVDFVIFIKNHTPPTVFRSLSFFWGKLRKLSLTFRRH